MVCAQKAQKNDKLNLAEDSKVLKREIKERDLLRKKKKKDFLKWKETLLRYEVTLLETLCFDLTVQQAHTSLCELETLLQGREKYNIKGKRQLNKIYSITFSNT